MLLSVEQDYPDVGKDHLFDEMVEKSEQLREVLVTVQDKLVVNGQRIIR
jgi:hypothetical protein